MKKSPALVFLFATIVLPNACKKDETDDFAGINSLVSSGPNLPPPPAAHAPLLLDTHNVDLFNSDGIQYGCEAKSYSYANNMSDLVALNPNAGTLYPGSLVQGKFVQDGILNSVGNFDRAPLQITMDNYGYNRTIEEPDNASITQAVQEMVAENTQSTIAKVNYRLVEMHNLDQAMLELGMDLNWGLGSLSGSVGSTTQVDKHSILLSFVQEYFTVSVEQPSDPSDFFGSSVRADALKDRISADNPLCYLSSVTYGRIVLAKITSTSTFEQLKSAISGSYGLVNGEVAFSNSSILENSEYEVMILGGNAQDAVAAAQGKMEGIAHFLNRGSSFGPDSRGVPISYTVRHASDNSLVKLGKALEYIAYEDCSPDPNAYKTIQVRIDGFEIVRDCDNGLFSNTGSGEFTYDIKIKDNQVVRKQIATETESSLDDGDYLNIDAGFYPIQIVNQNNHKLVIDGYLYEADDNGSSITEMKIPAIEFPFPFSQITSINKTWTQAIDYGNSCSAKLWITTKK